jgi:hypothetical protein
LDWIRNKTISDCGLGIADLGFNTDDRGQKTEDGRQRIELAEVGMRKVEVRKGLQVTRQKPDKSEIHNPKSPIERLVTRNSQPVTRNPQHAAMRKFSPDQLILALILGTVILGLTIYRFFYT